MKRPASLFGWVHGFKGGRSVTASGFTTMCLVWTATSAGTGLLLNVKPTSVRASRRASSRPVAVMLNLFGSWISAYPGW